MGLVKGVKLYKSDTKLKLFANIYITNGFNATAAYKKLNPNNKNSKVATIRGSYYLNDKRTKKHIEELLMKDSNKELEEINKAINANLLDTDISYKDKLQYIRTSLELKGKLNNQHKNTQVNVGIVVNKDNK